MLNPFQLRTALVLDLGYSIKSLQSLTTGILCPCVQLYHHILTWKVVVRPPLICFHLRQMEKLSMGELCVSVLCFELSWFKSDLGTGNTDYSVTLTDVFLYRFGYLTKSDLLLV